jgi:hypothetical protein
MNSSDTGEQIKVQRALVQAYDLITKEISHERNTRTEAN